MATRPAAVTFNVLGTVFSLEPLRAALVESDLPADALELWFARTLRDGFALGSAGSFAPFSEVARGTLEGVFAGYGRRADAKELSAILGTFSRLPAHPDARDAFDRLSAAGVPILALSNGGEKNTRELLACAGLLPRVREVVSIDDVGAWKPRAEVYAYTARRAGVEPGRLGLVAAHAWDCHGAARAGLVTGWLSWQEKVFNPALGRPDVQADTLPGVVEALLALPAG